MDGTGKNKMYIIEPHRGLSLAWSMVRRERTDGRYWKEQDVHHRTTSWTEPRMVHGQAGAHRRAVLETTRCTS